MAALGSQTIADSYEQLLHVDRDGGGDTTAHVNVKDGDNGTTFGFTIASDALMMTGTNRLQFGDTGTYIHQSADGVLDLVSDTEIEINATTIDINGAAELSGIFTVGVVADSGSHHADCNDAIIINGADAGTYNPIVIQEDGNDRWRFNFEGSSSTNSLSLTSNSTPDAGPPVITFLPDGKIGAGTTTPSNDFVISDYAAATGNGIEFGIGSSASTVAAFNRSTSSYTPLTFETAKLTFAPQGTNPVVIDQGANDGEALSLKSSDVAHPQTNTSEADTYGRMMKASATGGGLRIDGFNDANNIALEMIGNAQGDSDGRSTSTNGAVVMRGVKTTGNDPGDLPSDSNILVVANRNTVRFIFDTDGDFHADNAVNATAFDTYNDAQLVRAFDLSHGKGVIKSKFDEFVNYQHETLAELELVGREEDGTPNHFINVTGMQRLHNGAIWQQYTEMQKMKELMYDTMVEMLGKSKADAKLKDHDIKLLDNKNLLN